MGGTVRELGLVIVANLLPRLAWQSCWSITSAMAGPATDGRHLLERPGVERRHHAIHPLREFEIRFRGVGHVAVHMAMRALDAERLRPQCNGEEESDCHDAGIIGQVGGDRPSVRHPFVRFVPTFLADR